MNKSPNHSIRIRTAEFFLGDPKRFRALLLAKVGQSYDVIQRETGLTRGAIAYALKKAGTKLKDYRNGENVFSRRMITGTQQFNMGQLENEVGKYRKLYESRETQSAKWLEARARIFQS